jgi:hypothetical protein
LSSFRAVEVLLVALLVVATGGTVFQMQNQRQLSDLVTEVRAQTQAIAALSQKSAPAPMAAQPKPEVEAISARALLEAMNALTASHAAQPRAVSQPAPSVVAAVEPAQPVESAPAPHPVALETPAPSPAPAPKPVAEAKPLAPLPPTIDPASQATWTEFGPPITSVISQLLEGQYDSVVRQFDPTLAANLPKNKVAQIIDPIRADHGVLKRVVEHEPISGLETGFTGFSVLVELTDGHRIQFWITLDAQKRVAGLLMK